MTEFATRARAALAEKNISIRGAARALNYDGAFVSRVLSGKQRPSAKLARGLDQLVGAEGSLMALASRDSQPASSPKDPPWAAGPGSDDDLEALELARRVEASDVGTETLDRLEEAFDGLAMAYQRAQPSALLRDVRRHSSYVAKLLDERKTLSEHRRLLVLGGWLSLLGATLHVDLKEGAAAASRLRTAALLAQHAEHPEIQGWVFETRAWTALISGDYGQAVDLSRAAQAIAPRGGSVAIQATAQEGRARARLGEKTEAYNAIDRVQQLASTMVMRARPEHHYQYDPNKATSYTATTLAWIGDPAAEAPAREVIGHSAPGSDPGTWPRRIVTAHLDLALTLLSLDRLDEATDAAQKAILSGRLLPANYWRVLEIVRAVEARKLPEAPELREAYQELSP
ncbi:transcriptional regulator [Streptomyces sp. MZ04]|uniref:transcriptional regulator n=1 Tax=Streptomyces sp. MZ04 TaxID=2559236 RepID=UPI00107E7FAB|nr:transcriptional regulator [Streptomyces sp. MZ04]TGA88443.1 transcriptional regulator [Streptomyces sp. MZ04]